VLPAHLPLPAFYAKLVRTQHGAKQLWATARNVAPLLAHGQTNFLKMLSKFHSVYDTKLQPADHERPVRYEVSLARRPGAQIDPTPLRPQGPGPPRPRDRQHHRAVC
jgi:hypothetical protein